VSETIDGLTIEFTQDDVLVVKQVDKIILTRGNWTTIMFKFQEKIKDTPDFGPERVSIRRYQKRNGTYRQQSKFNISSAKQAREISANLLKWFPENAEGAAAPAAASEED